MEYVVGLLASLPAAYNILKRKFKGLPVFVYIYSKENQCVFWDNVGMRWNSLNNSLYLMSDDYSPDNRGTTVLLSPGELEVVHSKRDKTADAYVLRTRARLMRALGCEEKIYDVVWNGGQRVVYTSMDLFRMLYNKGVFI